MIDLIENLSNASGAPGFEDEVVQVIKDYLGSDYRVEEDCMRNLVIKYKDFDAGKPTVMLDGHSDEVAFMVRNILANGTMKVQPLGGFSAENAAAGKVRIQTGSGRSVTGIFSSRPPHFTNNQTEKLDFENTVLDVGAVSREETCRVYGIEPGDPVIPVVKFEYDGATGNMIGKAFDNRLGCACVLHVMEQLKGKIKAVNLVGSISAQEEVGTRGARVNATSIKPDAAIVFEGTPADDTFRNEYEAQGKLKGGTQIRHRDRSMVSNARFIRFAKEIARDREIKYQSAVRIGGGTNAGAIHIEEKAVPVLVLGTPVRYAHTHYGISNLEDYRATVGLAAAVLEKINGEIITSF